MATPRVLVRWLGAALVLAFGAAPAGASTVPVDVFGEVGDERIAYPPYVSRTYHSPIASVGNVGDVDRDGREDTAVVLGTYDPIYGSSVWVTFSARATPSTTAAGAPPWRGFRIVGSHMDAPVTGLGDVNGDGLREVAVQDDHGVSVVFGRTDGMTVDVSELGRDGFRIAGAGVGGATGFGTTYGGSAWQNTSTTAAGDQNGDGREDLAFVVDQTVRVAFSPPDPAGKELSAHDLGDGGFTLDTGPARYYRDMFVGRLGDLDADGRDDLLVAWDDADTRDSHAVGVVSPAPGTTEDLRTVARRGRGFALRAPGTSLENGIAVGDQDGDGRRDVLLSAIDLETHRREGVIAYRPSLGTERAIYPARPGEGRSIDINDGNVIDVGDQDGDGRADLAFSNVVSLSSADGRGERITPGNPAGLGGALYLLGRPIIVGSLADRNEDGRREILAVHAAPYADDFETGDHRATYMLDVFASAPRPLPQEVDLPVELPDAVEFAGTFLTSPGGGTRTLGARAAVELRRPDGTVASFQSPDVVDANDPRTRASVRVGAREAGLVEGETYRFRLLLENGRGLVGRGESHSFTFRDGSPDAGPTPAPRPQATPAPAPQATQAPPPRSDPAPGPPTPALPSAPAPARTPVLRLFAGSARADRLFGTSGRDLLRGGRGNDRLRGGGAADRLEGGSGADVLHGGRGRDVLLGGSGADRLDARDGEADDVRCGTGRDVARVDRRDRVRGCERVRR